MAVTLYYIGGLNAPDKKPTPIIASSKVFFLPKIGESITVQDWEAADLLATHTVTMPTGEKDDFGNDIVNHYPCFTRNKQLAQTIKSGRRPGVQQKPRKLTVEELQAMLDAALAEREAEQQKRQPEADDEEETYGNTLEDMLNEINESDEQPQRGGRRKKTGG